jgi:hypothetical protein
MGTWKNYKKKETPKPTNPLVGLSQETLDLLGVTAPQNYAAKQAAEEAFSWLTGATSDAPNKKDSE